MQDNVQDFDELVCDFLLQSTLFSVIDFCLLLLKEQAVFFLMKS